MSYFRDGSTTLDSESVECVQSAIVTMCLLVQSQLDYQTDEQEGSQPVLMKRNFFDKLLKNFAPSHLQSLFLSTLDELSQAYRIDKFLRCLLIRLLAVTVEYDGEERVKLTVDLDRHDEDENELTAHESNAYFGLFVKLLNLFNLNKWPRLIESLITEAFRLLVVQLELNKLPNLYVEFHLCEVIYRLETKYPILFDKCLNGYLDSANKDLDKRGRSYLLNTISFKFNSLKCRHTFKYQHVSESSDDLSLVQSLADKNVAIRSNSVRFLRLCAEGHAKQRFHVDSDFIRSELDSKLRYESSSDVLQQVLAFGVKLADYFSLDELLGDHLVSVLARSGSDWDECRLAVIDILFNDLYAKHIDSKDEFLDALLRVGAALFEVDTVSTASLIERMKKTAFFAHVTAESHSNGESASSSPIKK